MAVNKCNLKLFGANIHINEGVIAKKDGNGNNTLLLVNLNPTSALF